MRNSMIIPRIDDKRASINEVRLWLPKATIHREECEMGIKCLMNFRREWDEVMGCFKERPRHDWAMHGYDGLETLVRGLNAFGTAGTGVSIEDQERAGFVTQRRSAPDWRYS